MVCGKGKERNLSGWITVLDLSLIHILAHLDAKLRNSMRTELKEMQANLGSTCIYVTHDFMEAMALGDRIAIVNKGEIVQIGSGDEIYYMPCNEFVAQLMGDPQINIIPGEILKEGKEKKFRFRVGEESIVLPLPGEKEVDEKLESRGDVYKRQGR